jgi:hypothetical protein
MNKVLYAREGAKNIMDNTFDCFPWDVKLEIDGSKIDIPQASASHCDFFSALFMFWRKHVIFTAISARKNS